MADKPDMSEFKSVLEELVGAIEGFRMAVTGESESAIIEEKAYREDVNRTREALRKNTKATDENTTAKKASKIALDGLKDIAGATARELVNVGREGIKFGQAIGISATQGAQLEINNRAAIATQLLAFGTDLQVTMEQVKASQQGFSDMFTGAAEGMRISAQGSLQVTQNLKKGFNSEFEPTAETFRMLTQMGMSTTSQFEAFRKSTGRASLSNNQLASLYNKNSLSFLLYGNSFSRAAANAEKLGINLASVQAAQEGLVTNLDGTIDTVAQLNQLGAQLDFGELVRVAETEGPDALMALVRRSVPENLMQSASTRALFKQLGISVEDYMKSGAKQVSAADDLERQFTEVGQEAGFLAKTTAYLARQDQLLTDVFGEMYNATKKVISALLELALGSGIQTLTAVISGAGGISMATAFGSVAAGLGTLALAFAAAVIAFKVAQRFIDKPLAEGGSGTAEERAYYGRTPAAGGQYKIDEARSAELDRLLGAKYAERRALTAARQPVPPSLNEEIQRLTAENAALNAKMTRAGRAEDLVSIGNTSRVVSPSIANDMYSPGNNTTVTTPTIANDMYSPGYGSRVLVTPTKAFALNNADDIVAGTNLFPKGALQMGNDSSDLTRKVQALIDVLSNATTTVTINNTTQTVPRMQLVGVYSRNEVR